MYIRRPCGCRCVQYSILGGKAQGVRAIFLRQWIFFFFGGAGQSDPAPGGGLAPAVPADLAAAVPGGGLAFFVACRPCLWLALSPPSPYPPFPAGRGGPRLFHARGFAPCISGLEPGRHWGRGRTTHPAGGLPLRSRLTLPPLYPAGGLPSLSPAAPAFRLLCCPHPPAPLPLRGRGRPRLFHARGFAPCIPGIRPPAALTDPAEAAPCGVACLLCRLLPLPLALLLPPSPRPALAERSSRREGGDSKIILPGATAPGTPALNRLRHVQSLSCWCPEASLAGNRFLSVLRRTMGSATGMQGAKPLA